MYFNPNFPNFIATARQKLVAQHLGLQSLKQLGDFEEIITTNCRTWIVHGGLEYADAEVVANNIGRRRFTERTWKTTGLWNAQQTHSETWDYLMQPHEIRGLPEDQVLVVTVEGLKREVAAPILVQRPEPLRLLTALYVEPPVSNSPPPTIWEERHQQKAASAGKAGATPSQANQP